MKVARRYEPEVEPAEQPKVDLKAVVYALHMHGKSNQQIVEALGLTPSTVSRWINAAYAKGLMDKLERPREFGTRLECTCREDPLDPDGPPIVCVNCCASSRDHNPRLHAPPLPLDKKPPEDDGLRGGTDKGED